MTPVSLPAANFPSQPSRGGADLPSAPAPLAAPAMSGRVEWAGAVRPPDALLRAFRPDMTPKAPREGLTGPPPAFAANLLDHLPDSLERAAPEHAACAAPAADNAPTAPAPTAPARDNAPTGPAPDTAADSSP